MPQGRYTRPYAAPVQEPSWRCGRPIHDALWRGFLNLLHGHATPSAMRLSVVTGAVLFAARGPVPAAAATTIFSITAEPDYPRLRDCGKWCMWDSPLSWIVGRLNCPPPYGNDCMCRADLATAMSAHATSCLTDMCTPGDPNVDISTFLSLYNTYCLKNGYTLPGVAAAQTGTIDPGGGGTLASNAPGESTVSAAARITVTGCGRGQYATIVAHRLTAVQAGRRNGRAASPRRIPALLQTP